MKGTLLSEGINCKGISTSHNASGVANVTVDKNGNNTIVIVPGSNFDLDISDVTKNNNLINNAEVIMCQYETPMVVSEELFTSAKKNNKITILNPSPAYSISEVLLKKIDYLIINEHELSYLANKPITLNKKAIVDNAKEIQIDNTFTVIITLGKNGVIAVTKDKQYEVAGIQVKSIDSTAAGDCFAGAFAAHINKGVPLIESLRFANKAVALSVTKEGASTSLPYLHEVTKADLL